MEAGGAWMEEEYIYIHITTTPHMQVEHNITGTTWMEHQHKDGSRGRGLCGGWWSGCRAYVHGDDGGCFEGPTLVRASVCEWLRSTLFLPLMFMYVFVCVCESV